jgi:hypothetical protein
LEIFLAYLIGKSYVGMRVDDVHRWIRFLGEGTLTGAKPGELHLVAVGEAAVPALHAAALAGDEFRSVSLRRMVASWESVVAAGETYDQSVNVVHGALRHYDLADLVPLVAPGQVTIAEAVDAMGRPIP